MWREEEGGGQRREEEGPGGSEAREGGGRCICVCMHMYAHRCTHMHLHVCMCVARVRAARAPRARAAHGSALLVNTLKGSVRSCPSSSFLILIKCPKFLSPQNHHFFSPRCLRKSRTRHVLPPVHRPRVRVSQDRQALSGRPLSQGATTTVK